METFTNAARNTLLGLNVTVKERAALKAAVFVSTRNYWEVQASEVEVKHMMGLLRAEYARQLDAD